LAVGIQQQRTIGATLPNQYYFTADIHGNNSSSYSRHHGNDSSTTTAALLASGQPF
jgi:hypothetical protein